MNTITPKINAKIAMVININIHRGIPTRKIGINIKAANTISKSLNILGLLLELHRSCFIDFPSFQLN